MACKLKKIECLNHKNSKCTFMIESESDDDCWGTVHVDLLGEVAFSYDENITNKSELIDRLKNSDWGDLVFCVSCDVCEDETSAIFYFEDGIEIKDEEEAFKKAFDGILFGKLFF